VKIRKNSERERALFDFFELSLPKSEIIDEDLSTHIPQVGVQIWEFSMSHEMLAL